MVTKEMKLKYEAYINSQEWKELKIDLLQQRGCSCERCNKKLAPNKLQVHHKTYERLYEELATDLEILCGPCHMNEHGIIKKQKRKLQKIRKPKLPPKENLKKMYLHRKQKFEKRYIRNRYTTEQYKHLMQGLDTWYYNKLALMKR